MTEEDDQSLDETGQTADVPQPKAWTWDKRRSRAAVLLADGTLTDEQIAAQLKCSRASLSTWKLRPEFMVRVAAIRHEFLERIKERQFGTIDGRIALLEGLIYKGLQVITERTQHASVAGKPGGSTGLVIQQQKSIGFGRNQQIVEESNVDTGLMKTIADLAKQIAQETGQWTEKKEVSGTVLIREYDVDTSQV